MTARRPGGWQEGWRWYATAPSHVPSIHVIEPSKGPESASEVTEQRQVPFGFSLRDEAEQATERLEAGPVSGSADHSAPPSPAESHSKAEQAAVRDESSLPAPASSPAEPSWRCQMPTAVPPRPRCQKQCVSCQMYERGEVW